MFPRKGKSRKMKKKKSKRFYCSQTTQIMPWRGLEGCLLHFLAFLVNPK
jgi:hypothetical protein